VYEDRPEKDTPQHILDDLREYGGLSPDGQAIWRLVLAENCRIHCYGQQNHITRDTRELPDDFHPVNVVPDRTEVGEFWVPRYRAKGWILQRWFPASVWGSRQNWESERAQDGRTRLLAAYPNRGDYMMMPCGPWKSIAAAGDIKAAIRCYNAQQRANPVNWVNAQQAMVAWEKQRNDEQVEAFEQELEAQHRLGISSVLRSVSTNAQRVRNLVAETVGNVHLGASEKYG
jgi:hypothetical protein